MQKDVSRFFASQAVPEIYEKNEMLKNRGMCFFVIDCNVDKLQGLSCKVTKLQG